MKLNSKSALFYLTSISVLLLGQQSYSQPRQYLKNIAPGIQLFQSVQDDLPIAVSGLKVKPDASGVTVRAFVANDSISGGISGKQREKVTQAVVRTGAVAGVNGDFFPYTADPLGLTIVDGKLVSEPWPGRPAIGITADDKVIFGSVRMRLTLEAQGRKVQANGVNRPISAGEMIAYEVLWGAPTPARQTGAELVLSVDWKALCSTGSARAKVDAFVQPASGVRLNPEQIVLLAEGPKAKELSDAVSGQSEVDLRLILQDDDGRSWLGVREAVGGGSWLAKNLKIFQNGAECGFNSSFVNNRHPRTAAGVTKNGSLLLVVMDGRQPHSRGATLGELAQFMLDNGCTDAINLDGGGSSAVVAHGLVINSPSDGRQRPVANGFTIHSSAVPTASIPINISAPSQVMTTSEIMPLSVFDAEGHPLPPNELDSVIWGTEDGGGFIEQNGVLRAFKEGSLTARAWFSGSISNSMVSIKSPTPPTVSVSWDPLTPAGSNPRKLRISVLDSAGRPVGGAKVQINVFGGLAEPTEIVCDSAGTGSAVVKWNNSADSREVEVKALGVSVKIGEG